MLPRPSHKLVCQESTAAAKLKLVHTFTANVHIEFSLMDTFSLAFGFHKNMILDRPMIARCDLAIDASDLSIIHSLTSGQMTPNDYPNGVEGMLQIKSFIPLNPNVAIDAGRWKIWEQARVKNHRLQRGPVGTTPTGLIDFHMEGTDQVITKPLNILDAAIVSSRFMDKGVYVEHPTTGKEVHVPISVSVGIGFVNRLHFRQNLNNSFAENLDLSTRKFWQTRGIGPGYGRICRRRCSTSTWGTT